jgi:hypothetical protein
MADHKKNLDIERIILILAIAFMILSFGFAGYTYYYNNYVYEAPREFNLTLNLEDNNKENNNWVEINFTPLSLSLPSPLPY